MGSPSTDLGVAPRRREAADRGAAQGPHAGRRRRPRRRDLMRRLDISRPSRRDGGPSLTPHAPELRPCCSLLFLCRAPPPLDLPLADHLADPASAGNVNSRNTTQPRARSCDATTTWRTSRRSAAPAGSTRARSGNNLKSTSGPAQLSSTRLSTPPSATPTPPPRKEHYDRNRLRQICARGGIEEKPQPTTRTGASPPPSSES